MGMTQDELAKLVGYSDRTSIAKIESGKIDLPQSKIAVIAKALRTTPGELMGWSDSSFSVFDIPGIIHMPKMSKVSLVGNIACGVPILAEQNKEGEVDLPENVHADFALRCKGDSMIMARIHDGDIVYIRQQPDVENGEIAAVVIDCEATLKRVYKYENRIELRPENPTFPVLNYEGEDLQYVRIAGKAVAFTSTIR